MQLTNHGVSKRLNLSPELIDGQSTVPSKGEILAATMISTEQGLKVLHVLITMDVEGGSDLGTKKKVETTPEEVKLPDTPWAYLFVEIDHQKMV